MNRNTGAGQQALVSVSSGQYMGVRDSLTNSVPYPTKDTGRMILHDGNQAVVSACPAADARSMESMHATLTACAPAGPAGIHAHDGLRHFCRRIPTRPGCARAGRRAEWCH